MGHGARVRFRQAGDQLVDQPQAIFLRLVDLRLRFERIDKRQRLPFRAEILVTYETMRADCKRITCSVKIDYREGKKGRLESKIASVEEKLGKKLKM